MNRTRCFDFSAEFGGRDAAEAVLPHFKALKKAAREVALPDFPVSELTFILRVDGEVHAYGFRGAANIDIDKKGAYVSVDIGIAVKDRQDVQKVICEAIQSSVALLSTHSDQKLRQLDGDAVRASLRILCDSYVKHLVES